MCVSRHPVAFREILIISRFDSVNSWKPDVCINYEIQYFISGSGGKGGLFFLFGKYMFYFFIIIIILFYFIYFIFLYLTLFCFVLLLLFDLIISVNFFSTSPVPERALLCQRISQTKYIIHHNLFSENITTFNFLRKLFYRRKPSCGCLRTLKNIESFIIAVILPGTSKD